MANSLAVHNAAVNDARNIFTTGGASVQTEVTMNATVGGVTTISRADMVLTAPNGITSLPVPAGYTATDITGNPITSIPVNSIGQTIVEIKTGNGPLTDNQSIVYPQAQAGSATGTGANAVKANIDGSIPSTPVVILRKQ